MHEHDPLPALQTEGTYLGKRLKELDQPGPGQYDIKLEKGVSACIIARHARAVGRHARIVGRRARTVAHRARTVGRRAPTVGRRARTILCHAIMKILCSISAHTSAQCSTGERQFLFP